MKIPREFNLALVRLFPGLDYCVFHPCWWPMHALHYGSPACQPLPLPGLQDLSQQPAGACCRMLGFKWAGYCPSSSISSLTPPSHRALSLSPDVPWASTTPPETDRDARNWVSDLAQWLYMERWLLSPGVHQQTAGPGQREGFMSQGKMKEQKACLPGSRSFELLWGSVSPGSWIVIFGTQHLPFWESVLGMKGRVSSSPPGPHQLGTAQARYTLLCPQVRVCECSSCVLNVLFVKKIPWENSGLAWVSSATHPWVNELWLEQKRHSCSGLG